MDCHILRVVDFDTPPVRKKSGGGNVTFQPENRYIRKKHQSVATAELDCKTTASGERGGGDQNANTCTAPPKILSLMKHRSSRGIFRKLSQTKSKKHTRKNTSIPEDLKESHEDNEYSNRRSRFNLFFNRESSLNLRSKGSDVRRSKKRERGNFVFGREIPNLTTRSRKPVMKQRLENNRFRSPNDTFGFQRSNQSVYSCLNQMSCDFVNIDNHVAFKRLKKCLRRNSCSKETHRRHSNDSIRVQHQLKVLKLDDQVDTYYNVNYNERSKHVVQPTPRCRNRDNWTREKTDLKKNLHVLVSTASSAPFKKCRVREYCYSTGDKITPEMKCRATSPYPCNYVKTLRLQPPYTCRPRTVIKSDLGSGSAILCEPSRLVSDPVGGRTCNMKEPKTRSVKVCMKYVSLGLLLVVCSPCLLMGFLAWILKCPAKTTDCLSDTPSKNSFTKNCMLNKGKKKCPGRVYQREHSDCSRSQKSVLSSLANLFARAVDTTTASLNAMLSLLKINRPKQPTCAEYHNAETPCYVQYTENSRWVARPESICRKYRYMRCEGTRAPAMCPGRNDGHAGPLCQNASISEDCILTLKCSDNASASRGRPASCTTRDRGIQGPCGPCNPGETTRQQSEPTQSCSNSFGTPPCKEHTPVCAAAAPVCAAPAPVCAAPAPVCVAPPPVCADIVCPPCDQICPKRKLEEKNPCCCKKKKKVCKKIQKRKPKNRCDKKPCCQKHKKKLAKEMKQREKERKRKRKAMRKQCKKLEKDRKNQEKRRRREQKALRKNKKALENRNRKIFEKCKSEMEKKLREEKAIERMKKRTDEHNRHLRRLMDKRAKRENQEKRRELLEARRDVNLKMKIMKQKMKLNKTMKKINKMKRKFEEKERKAKAQEDTERDKLDQRGYFRKCWRELVAFEKRAFPEKISCNAKFVHTLRNRPCLWIYRMCPSVYPCFLHCYRAHLNLTRMLVYLFTFLIWAPIIYCCNCCICMSLYLCGC